MKFERCLCLLTSLFAFITMLHSTRGPLGQQGQTGRPGRYCHEILSRDIIGAWPSFPRPVPFTLILKTVVDLSIR
ncbi:hypothetical protein F4805DRAFT_446081 [Annulohypoxylon moriforme]|nr:hypothetical protein F4805DRAFT_446081 [Annulohypoxylon moriforme]